MYTPKITLDQWRAFHAVVTYGGYAQAAIALSRSQSSVSYNVQQLQIQLGFKCLEIQGRKAELTEKGRSMLVRAQHLLQQAQDIETFASSIEQGWEAEIKLVVDNAFPAEILMSSLKQFSDHCPNTRVQLSEVVLSGAKDALINQQAELVIGASMPADHLEDVLIELKFLAVAHPDHYLHQLSRQLTETDLSQQNQVVIRDSGTRMQQDFGWLNAENRWTVGSIGKAMRIISAGLGFGWLPIHSIEKHLKNKQLKALNLSAGATYSCQLYLAFANKENPGPGTKKLAKIIKNEVNKINAVQYS